MYIFRLAELYNFTSAGRLSLNILPLCVPFGCLLSTGYGSPFSSVDSPWSTQDVWLLVPEICAWLADGITRSTGRVLTGRRSTPFSRDENFNAALDCETGRSQVTRCFGSLLPLNLVSLGISLWAHGVFTMKKKASIWNYRYRGLQPFDWFLLAISSISNWP